MCDTELGISGTKQGESSLGKITIDKVSGIFVPIISVLTGTAILKGLLILLVAFTVMD